MFCSCRGSWLLLVHWGRKCYISAFFLFRDTVTRLLHQVFLAYMFFGLVRGRSREPPEGPQRHRDGPRRALRALSGASAAPGARVKNLKTHTFCGALLSGPGEGAKLAAHPVTEHRRFSRVVRPFLVRVWRVWRVRVSPEATTRVLVCMYLRLLNRASLPAIVDVLV